MDDITTLTTSIMPQTHQPSAVADYRNTSDTDPDPLPFVRLVCEVYITMPLAMAGIVGSILSFAVLCNHRPRLTPTVVLQYLALADVTILALCLTLRSFRYIEPPIPGYSERVFAYVFCILYPIAFITRMFGTWLVVLLTIDRYIAVCHPLQASRLCTVKRTLIIVAVMFVSSVVFSLPRFFEYYLDDESSFFFTVSGEYRLVYWLLCFILGLDCKRIVQPYL